MPTRGSRRRSRRCSTPGSAEGGNVDELAGRNLGLQTRLNRALEERAEAIRAPPLANPRQARMIGQPLVNAITDEPANSDVDVRLAHQLAVMHDTAKQAREHQADCDLGIDARPTVIEAIQVGDLIPQPRKVENTIDAHQHMVIRNKLS